MNKEKKKRNVKLVRDIIRRGLGRSEEDWKR
jgi:hypothetical protein